MDMNKNKQSIKSDGGTGIPRSVMQSGRRLLALYLNVNGNHKFMINELFPQEGDLG